MDLGAESIRSTSSVVKSDADDHTVQRIQVVIIQWVILRSYIFPLFKQITWFKMGALNFKPKKWGYEQKIWLPAVACSFNAIYLG